MHPETERLIRMRIRLSLAPLYGIGCFFFGSIAGFFLVWLLGYFARLSR